MNKRLEVVAQFNCLLFYPSTACIEVMTVFYKVILKVQQKMASATHTVQCTYRTVHYYMLMARSKLCSLASWVPKVVNGRQSIRHSSF
jgi:hypothetical protein